MALIQINVTYDATKETLAQALASLLTAKPEITETPVQLSLFDNINTASETEAIRTAAYVAQRFIPANEVIKYIDMLAEQGLSDSQVRAVCGEYVSANAFGDTAATVPAVLPEPVPDEAPAPQPEPAPAAPKPDPAPEAKKVTKTDVRALSVALSKKDKGALKAILKELGATCFSDVKEEDYPRFHELLVAANGKS